MRIGLNRRRKGSALIELAISWPVLSLLFFGVLDYARLMGTYSSLCGAARAAAQKAIDDTPTFALAASATDQTSWNAIVSDLQTTAAQNVSGTGLATTVTRSFACPSGSGGEATHQATVPTCANYRTYVRISTSLPTSAWVPIPRVLFPTSLAGVAMVRVK
jgi:Flp pilus assembly protein TadG